MPAATMLPSLQASHPTDTAETPTIDRAFGKPSNNSNSSSIDRVGGKSSSSGVTASSSVAWIQASASKEDNNSVNTESLTASTETSAGTRSNHTTNNVMEGIKEVASGTLENIKEWAVSPKQNRCIPMRREEDDCVLSDDDDDDNENPPQSTVSKQQQQPSKKNPTAMEDSGITTLSSSPSYQQQQQQAHQQQQQQQSHQYHHQAQSVPPQTPLSPTRRARPAGIETTRRPKNPQDPTRSLIRDLISPFIACGLVDPSSSSSAQNGGSNANGNSSTLSPTRRYKNRAASSAPNGALWDAFIERQTNVDDSSTVFSYDSATEEEILQLRRLTSWATINTMETDDASYMAGSITSESSFATNGTNPIQAVDDDGHVIPQILLEQAQRRRRQQQQQMRKRRTKLVRFEYPPISRLRECPRHDPQDLPDLFFTEEELDEIEADRYSTLTADDVEIVAVQTSEEDMETLDRFTAYQSTPKLRNNGGGSNNNNPLARRPASPYPRGIPTSPAGSDVQPGMSGDQSEAASSAANSNGSTRLIRGVQIYLRERSTGRSVASANHNNR